MDAANALITRNDGRLGKNLWTDAGAGEPIRLHCAWNDQTEAAYLVDEAKALHREGMSWTEMAVLYRSNAQSRVLEHALFQAGIPYRVYGGLRFFERQEIKHALAYLKLIADPDADHALLRVINTPARGIGARSVENLHTLAREQGISLWQAACGHAKGRAAASLARFVLLLDDLRDKAAQLPFAELVSYTLEASGLRALYQADKEGADRLENLDELVSAATCFVCEDPTNLLNEFLAHAALEAGDHQAGSSEAALHMMTVHAAKGLEFEAVFVSGLEEGLFPHENAQHDANGVEEERRMMNGVNIRDHKRLYFSPAQQRMVPGSKQ